MPRETILVVDDDPAIVFFLTDALAFGGYHALCAAGAGALALAQAAQPDLVLLDLLMPGVDGATVSRQLRATATTAHIPIVAMTATPALARQWGMVADEWLPKPFELDALYTVVERWCRLSSGRAKVDAAERPGPCE